MPEEDVSVVSSKCMVTQAGRLLDAANTRAVTVTPVRLTCEPSEMLNVAAGFEERSMTLVVNVAQPVGHTTQSPFSQDSAPVQPMPQSPQFSGSLVTSTHAGLQNDSPFGHAQELSEQLRGGLHGLLQAPQ